MALVAAPSPARVWGCSWGKWHVKCSFEAAMLSSLSPSTDRAARLRLLLADTLAMNCFSYGTAVPIELLIAGMSFHAHLQVRLAALVVNTLTGRPYGLWRSFLFSKLGLDGSAGRLRLYLGDTAAFLSFQLPIYILNMVIGGASLGAILKASVTATLISGLLGGPYGLFLDFIRRSFRVTASPGPEAPERASRLILPPN
jgi:hypothetical protein